jgi:hypothetical protein
MRGILIYSRSNIMTDLINVVRSTEVIKAIQDAGKYAASMYKAAVSAADLASAGLPSEGTLAERIDAIMTAYAAELSEAGHNVKAIFKDALTLFAAPDTAISLDGKKDGKKVEIQTTAKEAAGMAKHTMREAAKQVREDNGMSRKAGGGRKPNQPTTAPDQAANDGTPEEQAFAAWLSNLPVYFDNPMKALAITNAFKELGYKIQLIKTGK